MLLNVRSFLLSLTTLWLCNSFYSVKAANETIKIPKLNASIQLDGKLDEEFWSHAKKVNLGYETRPGENIPAKVKTTAYIAENSNSLLVAFVAEDPNPEKILASFKDRDSPWGDDLVGFKVDTFGDSRKAYNFLVNPIGIQMDSIENDVTGKDDVSWNGIWYSKGILTDTGYQVEIEIPFKVLRFPNTNQEKTWGIDFMRIYPREFPYRLAFNKVERDVSCLVCQISKATGFESIESGNNLELLPYVSARQAEQRELPSDSSWQGDGTDTDAGLDVRWGITDNSVLNVTLNPDFSQVESDAVQLDVNTRFALFNDEKRPFFVEGAEFFNTMLTIFYSRNIADPDAGVKYISESDTGSLGLLVNRDSITNIVLPDTQSSRFVSLDQKSNSAAFRYAHNWSQDTILGVSMTRRSSDDYSNDLISFDGKHQLTDSDVLRYQVIHTETENPLFLQTNYQVEEKESGSAYRLNYSHNDRDWTWYLSHNQFDENFRADLGFLNQSGYRKSVIGAGRRWYGEQGAFFNKVELRGDWDTTTRFDGQKLETETEVTFSLEGKAQSKIDFHFGSREFFYDLQWFDQDFYDIAVSFKPISSLKLGFKASYNDEIDYLSERARPGKVTSLNNSLDWQLSKNLNWVFEYVQQDFDLDEGNYFKQELINSKMIYHFNEKSFLRLLVRYRDIEFEQLPLLTTVPSNLNNKSLVRQLLYAHKFDAKSALYIGYSDRGRANDQIINLEQDGRTIFAKFSYAFQL